MTTLVNETYGPIEGMKGYRNIFHFESENCSFSRVELFQIGGIRFAGNDWRQILEIDPNDKELFPDADFRLECTTRVTQRSPLYTTRIGKFVTRHTIALYYEAGEINWNDQEQQESGWVNVRIYDGWKYDRSIDGFLLRTTVNI